MKEINTDIIPEEFKRRAEQLAEDHINWLFGIMKPIMVTQFCHGFRRGWELAKIDSDIKKSKKDKQ